MVRKAEGTVSILDILRKDRYAEAEGHRRRRDELSAEARNWALRRDQYRERSKEAHKEALEARDERDAINIQAKEVKGRRDQAQARAAELKGKDKEAYAKAREEGQRIHEELTAVAEKSRAANDRMVSLFEESKVDKVLAEAAHKKFIECRKESDREHKLYLETQRSARSMNGIEGERKISVFECPKGEEGREALRKMNEHHAPLADWAIGFLPETVDGNILDIGCGGGMLIGKLHDKYPCARLHGIDISEESVRATRENNPGIEGLEVRRASVSRIPYPDNHFQLVTAVETYFFWPDLAEDLRSAARCIQPGGTMMVVSEMYPDPDLSEHQRAQVEEYGMNILGNDEMVQLMESAGLKVECHTVPENSWVAFIGTKS